MAVNWPGLLRWSLQHSDGTKPQSAMSAEDMRFLESAIKQYLSTAEDPNKAVEDAVDVIREVMRQVHGDCYALAACGANEDSAKKHHAQMEAATGDEPREVVIATPSQKANNERGDKRTDEGAQVPVGSSETCSSDATESKPLPRRQSTEDAEVAGYVSPEKTLLSAVAMIQHCIDEVAEVSRNLSKLGAVEPLTRLLALCSDHSVLLTEAILEVISFAVQNNPEIQAALVMNDGLNILRKIVSRELQPSAVEVDGVGSVAAESEDTDAAARVAQGENRGGNGVVHSNVLPTQDQSLEATDSAEAGGYMKVPTSVQTKAFSALAGLIRQHRESELVFVLTGGMSLLVDCMMSRSTKLQQKAACLTKHLLLEGHVSKEEALKCRLASGLCNLLDNRQLHLTGICFGETCAELVIEALKLYRPFLAKTGDLHAMQQAIAGRAAYVESTQKECTDDDVSHELSLLTAASRLARFPGMVKSK